MFFFNNLITSDWFLKIIKSIIIIIISFTLYKIIILFSERKIENEELKVFTNKTKTYIKLIKSIIRYIFIIGTILILFQANGINITSMIAGVGIIGIILGFAVQDALKDIIKGFDILSDSYYEVGDVIKFGEIEGKVLSIGLKTTKIEDIYSKNIVSISNRNIEQVEILSNLINIDVPLPYEIKIEEAEKAIEYIVKNIKKQENIENCEYRGINNLADSSINYQIKVYCAPTEKVQVRRDSLRYILKGLEKHNINIPFNQIDIHQK